MTVRHIGVKRQDIADRQIEIALGQRRDDKAWKNIKGTVDQFLLMLAKHEIGEKDGKCILQGSLSGPQRVAKNVVENHILMVDIDTGTPVEEIVATLEESNLFGVVWTTFSHMKPQTEIGEDAFLRWKKKQIGAVDDQTPMIQRYLTEEKKYTDAIVDSVSNVVREHVDGGVKFIVEHAPMPRCRVMFLLDKKFEFGNRGSQSDAIQEWKDRYAGVSTKLGVEWDRSCVDPSRLMYLPRVPRGADLTQHSITVVWGDALTEDRMPRIQELTGADDSGAAFVSAGTHSENVGSGLQFEPKTSNLLRFAAKYSKHFEAADWLQSLAPDLIRGNPATGGIEFQCPNEDGHTEQKSDDRAFLVKNASDSLQGTGFTMLCLHNTCKTLSDGDRLWYLDLACQQFGIADAMTLAEYCTGEEAEREQANQASETRAAQITIEGNLEERIGRLTPQSPATTIQDILRVIAKEALVSARDRLIRSVKDQTRIGIGALRADVDIFMREQHAQAGEGTAAVEREPADPDKYQGAILTHWHFDIQFRIVKRRLEETQKKDAKFFKRPEGGYVRVVNTPNGVRIKVVSETSHWVNVLADSQIFFTRLTDDGPVRVSPPRDVLNALIGCEAIDLPVIERVIRVPVFAPDGSIMWEGGYSPSLRAYLDPDEDWRAVPDQITDGHLDEAWGWLLEMYRDFPFYDYCDGSDLSPIKLEEKDTDGFRLPNLDRGRSSRVNCIAMLMQPFVRGLIDGPCPNYHIDKKAAGTGAGYLADTVFLINEGTKAVVQPISESKEELKKSITATLREGAPIVFIDNIPSNFPVDNGALAAALTAGIWRDRVLGVSETATIPINCVWIMAGNKIGFSNEMYRRNVRIGLDANTDNPAGEREGGIDFKHFPLQPWVIDNRVNIIWSIHVLVKNWVDRGMQWGPTVFNSFDAYAGVMSGIFNTAGVGGFLDNFKHYYTFNTGIGQTNGEDGSGALIQIIWDRFQGGDVKASDVVTILENPMSEVTFESLGFKTSTSLGRQQAVGRYLTKYYVGTTHKVQGGGTSHKVKMTIRSCGGSNTYNLAEMTD